MPNTKKALVPNRLLAALPRKDYEKLLPLLTPVNMVFEQVLYESHATIRHVYFPGNGLVSMLTTVDGGRAAEVGLIGSEGMIGVPAALGIAFVFVLPISILFSVAGTQFRDLRYITMLMLQAMFFLTPVMLKRSYLETPPLDILNIINPAVPLINLFREPMLYGQFWDTRDVIVLAVWTGALWVAAVASSVIFGRKVIFAL